MRAVDARSITVRRRGSRLALRLIDASGGDLVLVLDPSVPLGDAIRHAERHAAVADVERGDLRT